LGRTVIATAGAAPRQTIIDHAGVLGGSEIGVVLGLSPYQAPSELWEVKRGEVARFQGNEQTEWGQDVEPAVRAWYVRRAGEAVYVPPISLLHPEHPWLRATPDGIVLVDADADPAARSNWRRGFEAKKAGGRVAHYWGEPGTDEVPLWYLVQCQAGMAVTGLDRWDLAASIAGEPPEVYVVRRDDALIDLMLEAGREFLDRVARGVPPEVDGTEAYADFIARRHPWSREDYLTSTPELDEVAAQLRDVRDTITDLEGREALLENQIRAAIGDASGLVTAIGRFTYKPKKGAPKWKEVACDLAKRLGLAPTALAQLADGLRAAPSRPLLTPRSRS